MDPTSLPQNYSSRQNGYYLQNVIPLRPERRTRPINLHGLHGNVVVIIIGPSVRKLATYVPNNDFNQSKQGKNVTKDTVVTYLYIKNPQKLSTASKNLFEG